LEFGPLKERFPLFLKPLVAAVAGSFSGCGANDVVEPPVQDLAELAAGAVEQGLPGVIVLIEGPAGTQLEAAGLADVDAGTEMATDARFRIASNTKSFVGYAAAALHVQQRLDLDAAATQYLPDDYDGRIANLAGSTVRQLLNHTSGIYDYLDSDAFSDAIEADPSHEWIGSEVVEYAFDQSAYFEVGADWGYSNTNYILAGLVIDAVTGNHHAQTIREHVFTPLQMTASFYENAEEATGPIVHGYVPDGGSLQDMHSYNTGFGLADGGIVSTAEELAVYIRAIAGRDNRLPSDTVSLMLEEAASLEDGEVYGLGLSLFQTTDGPAYGHGGNIEGYSSDMFYYPERDVVIIVMANGSDGGLDEVYSNLVDDVISLALD